MIRLLRLAAAAVAVSSFACSPKGSAPPCAVAGQSVCAPTGAAAFCTDLTSDINNCGTCGSKCSAPSGGAAVCNKGVCAAGACAGGRTGCNGVCCGPSEVCNGSGCDPCPVTQCNNVCVDTQHDPKNCGACGVVAPYCENGAPLAAMIIEPTPPLSASGTSYAYANPTATPIAVKVHSQLRVTSVTVKTAPAGSSCTSSPALGTATAMALSGPPETSPTRWTGTITAPATGATFAAQFDALDEQQHAASLCLNVTSLAVPTAAPANITATAGTTALGNGTGCNGKPCMWAPLNGPPITLSATVAGAAASNITRIEFRNANTAPGSPGNSILCPSQAAIAAPPASTSPCSQPVNGSGTAPLTLPAAEVGKGDITIYACPVDAAGQYPAACTQMPYLSVCGTGTTACTFNFTIGRVALAAGGSQPVIGRNINNPSTNTIYYTANDTGPQPAVFAQDSAQLSPTTIDQPGTRVGTTQYFLDSLVATAEGTGAYAVRCTSCTPAANGIDRIDCPSTSTTGCLKNFIASPGGNFRQIHTATPVAMLISDSAPPTGFGGNAFYAPALPTQGTTTAVPMFTLQQITVNGAAPSNHFGTMASGAIAAWFSSGGLFSVQLFHPTLSPTTPSALLTPASGLTAFDLVVFPTGEIVFQYVSGGTTRFLGAAYYDGTSAAPKTLTPFPIGPAASTVLGKNFVRAGTGIILGEIPTVADATKFQAIELNLTSATPFKLPLPTTAPTGPFHESGVFSRLGQASSFSVSDDKTKAIYVTDDPNPTAGAPNPKWNLYLIDLATGVPSSVYASDRMLLGGGAHLPRFVHSAPVYVGAAPAGTHQALVLEEELPPPPGTVASGIRHARISFATFSGSGPPAVSTIDRLMTYSSFTYSAFTTEVDSAAAGAIFFLSDNDLGGADLYTVPLTPPAGALTTATRVLDRVFGFKMREEKGRLLVARADGTVYGAQPGSSAAGALAAITSGGPTGDPDYTGFYPSSSYGFTPDGDHAYVVRDQTFSLVYVLMYAGVLSTFDLNTGARVNWGRATFGLTPNAGFLANGSVAEIVNTYSSEDYWARLEVAQATNGPAHADTGLYFSYASWNYLFVFTPSLDGTEALVSYNAAAVNAFAANGNFLSLPGASESLSQPATTSPFGGPYRPEFSQVNGSFFSGASSSVFKVWGTASRCGGTPPAPFVTVSRGIAARSTPQTRQTPDYKELLYSFNDSSNADTTGSYAIWLPLAGCKAPDPLLP